MRLRPFGRGVLFVTLAAVVAACSTQPVTSTKNASPEAIQAMQLTVAAALKQNDDKVDALLAKGKRDDAEDLLKQAARKYPDSKEPWSRLAKIYFDDGSYGEAIEAADEVLDRDETDQPAKVIRAVSGLRVASQSLIDLRDDTNLKGSARADAVSLVKVLRETLGEDVLLPTAKELQREREREKSKRSLHKKKQYPRRAVTEEKKESSSISTVNGDPFSVLR